MRKGSPHPTRYVVRVAETATYYFGVKAKALRFARTVVAEGMAPVRVNRGPLVLARWAKGADGKIRSGAR